MYSSDNYMYRKLGYNPLFKSMSMQILTNNFLTSVDLEHNGSYVL